MIFRSILRWSLAVLPAGIGILLAIFIGNSDSNFLYELSISLNYFPLLIGFILSLLLFVAFGVWGWQTKSKNEALIQVKSDADSDRRRFLQRLDHELKNPLTAIRLGMANFASSDGEAREIALNSIDAQVGRLVRLTADIRKLVEMDTVELETEPVDLAQLITEAVELIKDHPEAYDKNISLSLPQVPWPLPNINADWDLIFLAIFNLLENAVKFTEKGDDIEIRARERVDSRIVTVEVADTGPGIDPSDLEHVWEELYRGFRTRSVSGSGLGLPLVKTITERHGGSVSLNSRSKLGSVFSVNFPVLDN